ncbi:MAG: L,D-transpeptidase family protein [Gammaproteobacteria bacterium]|nr:L,D-transpeptidase family protein [Gammaproteobacteria bacterium]MCZ6880801.1 L,D-transpeptidase family protein [Gammaproteobacteria bacterium]
MRAAAGNQRTRHGGRLILPLLLLFSVASTASAAESDWMADKVLVLKAQRKLFLIKDDRILKAIDIRLGLVPEGEKEAEGDFRTPEGSYLLDRRNLNSDYFLAIRISYPNSLDLSAARGTGLSPGGNVMIHGRPNEMQHEREYYSTWDWTDGCISVANTDMVDIWMMTGVDTPIEILP